MFGLFLPGLSASQFVHYQRLNFSAQMPRKRCYACFQTQFSPAASDKEDKPDENARTDRLD